MHKFIAATLLVSLSFCCLNTAAFADNCFVGSNLENVGSPGGTMPPTTASGSGTVIDNQPIIDDAAAIRSAFNVNASLYESNRLDDFSTKSGYVYVGAPLVSYLVALNGTDPASNGVGYIVAHEYAHQFQFRIWASGHDVQPASAQQIELQADVIAGIWAGIVHRQYVSRIRTMVGPSFDRQLAIDPFEANQEKVAAEVSDYLDWPALFHGTDVQRKAAVAAGVQYGEYFSQDGPSDAFISYGNDIYDFSKKTASDLLSQ